MVRRRDVEERVLLALRRTIANSVLTNDAIARRAGLALVDAQVLNLLGLNGGPMTAGELGTAAALPSSTTTRVIDRLERAGYVQRISHPADRRKVYVDIVPLRLAELAGEYDEISAGMAKVLSGFSAQQLEIVAHFLEVITDPERAQLRPRGT